VYFFWLAEFFSLTVLVSLLQVRALGSAKGVEDARRVMMCGMSAITPPVAVVTIGKARITAQTLRAHGGSTATGGNSLEGGNEESRAELRVRGMIKSEDDCDEDDRATGQGVTDDKGNNRSSRSSFCCLVLRRSGGTHR
jgi:hypothetical protein